jgi:hypothetical protein
MAPKVAEVIEIQEAMDNLATIATIDLESPPPIGIVKRTRLVTDEEEFGPGAVLWLSEEGSESILSLLDATYRSIHSHLFSLYENPEMDWNSERSRKGIAAMMALVGESAHKMDLYLAYRMGKDLPVKVGERDDFKALQRFYAERFAPKFKGGVEGEKAWKEEWNKSEEAPLLDAAGSGLKDFETVQRDKEYELFYIRNEEGKPYFSAELLRNIKLTADFESEEESFEEDPLLKVRAMNDRDLHASAQQILGECHPLIQDFYSSAAKSKENDFVQSLSMAVIALLLAANPRHLLQNTTGKSCLQYFDDFHRFLRRSLKTTEYQKMIAYPPEKSDKISHLLLHLAHELCRGFFHRTGGVKQEAIGLIHRTMRRGEELQTKKQMIKGDTVWNQLLVDDEKFRTLLAKFPNGPLFKILDLVREEQEEDAIVPFDPIGQENLPSCLYEIHKKGKKAIVLRSPAPVRQAHINKAEIVDEFRGMLRATAYGDRVKKHMIVQLQDRTSWREHARVRAIESLQRSAEFSPQLFILTLPKETDFYHQNNEYINLNSAAEFIASFKAQLKSPEECGFFFPPQWKASEIARFIESALPLIHEHFFHGKNVLTRRNREDFIEIFYQLLILKAIDHFEPDSISFMCKDAIDTAAAASAEFYGFLKLLSGDFSAREEQDFLRWLFYTPALFIRERAIDAERFHRSLSALERLDSELSERGDKILKALGEHFHPQFFKTFGVKHL